MVSILDVPRGVAMGHFFCLVLGVGLDVYYIFGAAEVHIAWYTDLF